MKLVIQRVSSAAVEVEGKTVASIEKGLLVLLGISCEDNDSQIDWLANKLVDLRIFEDENGNMNLSLKDINGKILLVSQFTLYANCNKGRRPDFNAAARPELAEELYLKFAKKLEELGVKPKFGIFGAHMNVNLVNDGPVTISLEK